MASLILFSFLYVSTSFCSEINQEDKPQKIYHCISDPGLNIEVLTYIFEIAKQDRILLKNLRVACTLFRDLDVKLDSFYFRLSPENLENYKRRPYSSIIIRAETLKNNSIFFEKTCNFCAGITTLVLVNPEVGEDNRFNLVSLVSLRNLESLTLRNRKFGKKGFRPLMLLTSLTSLDLSGVRFHQFNGVSCLERLPKLNKLMLKECGGNKNSFENISRLTNLTELSVYGSALVEKEIKSILHLTQLRTLNIDGNMEEVDTFEGIENFTRLTGLETLGLDGDIFTSYQTFISSLTSLKSLTIDGEVCDMKKGLGHLFKSKSATM